MKLLKKLFGRGESYASIRYSQPPRNELPSGPNYTYERLKSSFEQRSSFSPVTPGKLFYVDNAGSMWATSAKPDEPILRGLLTLMWEERLTSSMKHYTRHRAAEILRAGALFVYFGRRDVVVYYIKVPSAAQMKRIDELEKLVAQPLSVGGKKPTRFKMGYLAVDDYISPVHMDITHERFLEWLKVRDESAMAEERKLAFQKRARRRMTIRVEPDGTDTRVKYR